jgi:hypothetical protein
MTWTTHQSLRFGPVTLDAKDEQPTPYFLSGSKLYAIGSTSGALEPVGVEHLVGEMGGVWAHPIKFSDGWYVSIQDHAGRSDRLRCLAFEGHLSDVMLHFAHGPLRITRTDFVVDDEAVLCSLIDIVNDGEAIWTGTIGFVAHVNILPAWFSGYQRGGVELEQRDGRVIAWDKAWQGRWGVVFGSSTAPTEVVFGAHGHLPTGELRYITTLAPDQRRTFEFLVACDHQDGHDGALRLFESIVGRGYELLEHKRQQYRQVALGGVTLHTPDQHVNTGWVLAKANLLMLQADYSPFLSGFFMAGIPEYPNLFGCDNTYTTSGATGAGFRTIMRSTLTVLGEYAQRQCGRVPHEVTTNGRVFNPGNTQETPQFAIAVWDYFRWTGDLTFLQAMYRICREGVMDYLPGIWDGDRDGYPTGDAMVERHGMGSLKLDSACYLYGGWRALAAMARVLGRPEASEYEQLAADWLVRFERDWWLEHLGLYADSLHSDYRPQLDGHWTQVVPIQMGIARPDHAQRVLEQIEREFTNAWGLVHTRDREDRVWTLPTGLLALAELRHGRAERALELLNNIARTAEYGMLGAFKELIPEGLCFVQLWSSGLYVQGMLEGLIGLEPYAHEHHVRIVPMLPASWPLATIKDLRIGAHLLNLTVTHTGYTMDHLSGPQAMQINFKHRGTTVAAISSSHPKNARQPSITIDGGVTCEVGVGQGVALEINDGTAHLTFIDRHSEMVSHEPDDDHPSLQSDSCA